MANLNSSTQHSANQNIIINNNNLLNPNVDFAGNNGRQQRRKSTLSGNGFFIDYSCTRRRSSAAVQQARGEQQDTALARSHFLRTYVSPVRYPSLRSGVGAGGGGGGSFCAGTYYHNQQQQQQCSSPTSPSRTMSRQSRATSYSAGAGVAGSSVLAPPLLSPFALAGSRKTSIFDPTGHSIGAAPQQLLSNAAQARRRRSTMITGGGPGDISVVPNTAMLNVARRAARNPGRTRKGELAQHVPVIGCSPTSITASLDALEETRRYEKLLRHLKRDQRRKEKLKKREFEEQWGVEGEFDEQGHDDNRFRPGRECGNNDENIGRLSNLRRKSLRAIKDATQLIREQASRRKGHRGRIGYRAGAGETIDDISISSLSLESSTNTIASMPSFDHFNDEELFLDGDDSRAHGQQQVHNRARDGAGSIGSLSNNNHNNSVSLKRGANILDSSAGGARRNRRQLPKASRTVSLAGGMNYWFYYYYYLRDTSFEAIDDLPPTTRLSGGNSVELALSKPAIESVGVGSGASGLENAGNGLAGESSVAGGVYSSSLASDIERRTQLHINYSLARIEILNSLTNPVEKLARRIEAAECVMGELEQQRRSLAINNNLASQQQQQQANAASANGLQMDPSSPLATTNKAAAAALNLIGNNSLASARFQSEPPKSPIVSELLDQSTDVSLALSTSSEAPVSASLNGSRDLLSSEDSDCDDYEEHDIATGSRRRRGPKGNERHLYGFANASRPKSSSSSSSSSSCSPSASLSVSTSTPASQSPPRPSRASSSSNSSISSSISNEYLKDDYREEDDERGPASMPMIQLSCSSQHQHQHQHHQLQHHQQQSSSLSICVPQATTTTITTNIDRSGSSSVAAKTAIKANSLTSMNSSPTTNGRWQIKDATGEIIELDCRRRSSKRLREANNSCCTSTSLPSANKSLVPNLIPSNQVPATRHTCPAPRDSSRRRRQRRRKSRSGSRRSSRHKHRNSACRLITGEDEARSARSLDDEHHLSRRPYNSPGRRSGHHRKHSSKVKPGRETAVNNEEELDDFERFNQSHRGYKPPPGLPPNIEPFELELLAASSKIKKNNKQKDSGQAKKSIRSRLSNLRQSIKGGSSYIFRNSQLQTSNSIASKWPLGDRQHKAIGRRAKDDGGDTTGARERVSGCSLSWDTLALGGLGRLTSSSLVELAAESSFESRQQQQQQQQQSSRVTTATAADRIRRRGDDDDHDNRSCCSSRRLFLGEERSSTEEHQHKQIMFSKDRLLGDLNGESNLDFAYEYVSPEQEQKKHQHIQQHQSNSYPAELQSSRTSSHLVEAGAAESLKVNNANFTQTSEGGFVANANCYSVEASQHIEAWRAADHHPESQQPALRMSSCFCSSCQATCPPLQEVQSPFFTNQLRSRSHLSVLDQSASKRLADISTNRHQQPQQHQAFSIQPQENAYWRRSAAAQDEPSDSFSAGAVPMHQNHPHAGSMQQLTECRQEPVGDWSARYEPAGSAVRSAFRRDRRLSASLRLPKLSSAQQQQPNPFSANQDDSSASSCFACRRAARAGSKLLVVESEDAREGLTITADEASNQQAPRLSDDHQRKQTDANREPQLRGRAHSSGESARPTVELSISRKSASRANMELQGRAHGQAASASHHHHPPRHRDSRVDLTPAGSFKSRLERNDDDDCGGGQPRKRVENDDNDCDGNEMIMVVQGADEREEGDDGVVAESLRQRQRNMAIFNKRHFSCLLLGSRQSGKRTIVKCFIKLLNEFKLAASEYRKEKMLAKLIDCSEQLQDLAAKRQEQLEAIQKAAQATNSDYCQQKQRLRGNSWFGGILNQLPMPANVTKRRLHSFVGFSTTSSTQANSNSINNRSSSTIQQSHNLSVPDQVSNIRRHTAIEESCFSINNNTNSNKPSSSQAVTSKRTNEGQQQNQERQTAKSNFLSVNMASGPHAPALNPQGATGLKRNGECNKSDFNINYQSSVNQAIELGQPPTRVASAARSRPKVKDDCGPNSSRASSARGSSSSPSLGSPRSSGSSASSSVSSSSSSLGDVGRVGGEDDDGIVSHKLEVPEINWPKLVRPSDGGGEASNRALNNRENSNVMSGVRPRRRRIDDDDDNNNSHDDLEERRRIAAAARLSRSRSAPLLSLKEINRRKVCIRFKTRRYLRENLLTAPALDERDPRGQEQPEVLDAFLVVYAVNDRQSFEFARSVICRLREAKFEQEPTPPIILIANKIDLERAKVIKSEEGRTLAKQNGCKFIEVSCTVGFNLDNLLVGLRTQLVLRHHIMLNAILRNNSFKNVSAKNATTKVDCDKDAKNNGGDGAPGAIVTLTTTKTGQQETTKITTTRLIKSPKRDEDKEKNKSKNILIRFYKRFLVDGNNNNNNSELGGSDNQKQLNYECDNFSKL